MAVTTNGNLTAEPGSVVTMQAFQTGQVDAWTCTQTGGTPVALAGSSSSGVRTFTAPLHLSTTPLTFEWIASQGSTTSAPVVQSVKVFRYQSWYKTAGGSWQPVLAVSF